MERNRAKSGGVWSRIIDAVTAPLGFFVLSLLIVEGFLGTVLLWADLENTDKVNGMYVGVGMFVLVSLLVSILVWFKPDNLTFDKEAHLRERGKPPFGTDQATVIDRDELLPTSPAKGDS